jgi:acetyl-CoA carboxylase biotin carboxylase subunit
VWPSIAAVDRGRLLYSDATARHTPGAELADARGRKPRSVNDFKETTSSVFRTLLVANRGEIALRVIRACRELGVRSVAVYSDPDRLSPHVLEADSAEHLGPAAASASYLNIERLLEAARRSGADAIHPGYGFLAEREPFARAVEDAGLTFVGPRPATIAAMGDKTEARRRMAAAGVPIVPGLTEPVAEAGAAARAADAIGYPVLLKAAAGGGGKGMRTVGEPGELARAFESASREALAAFGDGSVYLERYLDRPRHIEIQVLGDAHGKVLHLGERECSVQRRHQKLIEEAPSPVLTGEQREAMGAAAVRAAQAVEYRGAGTCEFLWHDGAFYFLEMNTRIQVEHPVTELVTGLDLVQWQLRVAAGEPLPFEQTDVALSGHALECRITAEDPGRGFLPSTGRVRRLEVPQGPGVRWDGGIAEGFEVGLHYDPLLAKLIVHAPDRAAAIARMARALDELVVDGVETSAAWHRRVMDEPDFRAGRLTIRYVDDHPELAGESADEELVRAAAVAGALLEEEHRRRRAVRRIGGARGAASTWRAPPPPAFDPRRPR